MDEKQKPVPTREQVAAMSPIEAWNAAISAAEDIADWSAFWDDGQTAPRKIHDLTFD